MRLRGVIVSCEAVAGTTAATRVIPPHAAARIAAATVTTTTATRIQATAADTGASASFVSPQNNRRGVSGAG